MNQRIREAVESATVVLEEIRRHEESSRANESPKEKHAKASIPHSK